MSTNYYNLKEPFTSVRILSEGNHDKITFWSRHGNAGTLIVERGDGKLIIKMLINYNEDTKCPMRTHWGGKDIGAIVTENIPNLEDKRVLISEYGEIVTVKEIRNRKGAKRADGMPTELFGFEVVK